MDTALDSYLKKHSEELSWNLVLEIARQIVCGMQYLQSEPRCVVHRDLKTANILLKIFESSIVCKVSDFGISRMMEKAGDKTFSATRGTPYYMVLPHPLLWTPFSVMWCAQLDGVTSIVTVGPSVGWSPVHVSV